MPLNIRSDTVNDLADQLARRQHVSKTEAVRSALQSELARLDSMLSLADRLKPLQDRVAARPATVLEADKAFYDSLTED